MNEYAELEQESKDKEPEEWKAEKRRQKAMFTQMQALPYEVKLKKAEQRAREFYEEIERRGMNCHVSVGGLDSITLFLFLKKIGINVPAISVSSLEDKSIQAVHNAFDLIKVKPIKSKVKVLQEDGFPVLSKKLAGRINTIQNPSEKNKTVRHAIITGECGEQGHFAKNSRMKLPMKWLKKFGGADEEGKDIGCKEADFKVSNMCCYWMKELPCANWAKEHNSVPYLGLMASEGGQREEAIVEHGCNYYGATVIRSAPFGIFMRNDLLRLTIEMDKWWKDEVREEFRQKAINEGSIKEDDYFLETIIPTIYGEILQHDNGDYYTTLAQRTGCEMCGFGVHLEQRPHRFDRLRERNYKEWEFWMYKCVKDEDTGEVYGWGKVLDYIGVIWEDVPPKQLSLF